MGEWCFEFCVCVFGYYGNKEFVFFLVDIDVRLGLGDFVMVMKGV